MTHLKWESESLTVLFVEGATVDESGRSSLLIENVTASNAGTYVCTAENAIGTVKALSFVRVTGRVLYYC